MGMLTIALATKAASSIMMKLGIRESTLGIKQVFNFAQLIKIAISFKNPSPRSVGNNYPLFSHLYAP
jgi:hypothetical protein